MAKQTDTSPATSVPPPLIQIFPDDISLQIIARVPRFRYPFLSLVSKSWHATVNSPELFRIRSLLRTAQSSLYLNIRFDSSFRWYSERNPQNRNRTFTPLPPIPQHPVESSILSLGPKIYVIGGSINDIPSDSVWVFDCRSNKWEMGPRMRVARELSAAGELNGKLYVMGGCNIDNWARSSNWAEVFDPETGLWNVIPTAIRPSYKWMYASAVIGSRIYGKSDGGGVVYDIGRGGWGNVPCRLYIWWRSGAAVVDNVLYCCYSPGKIRGYDVEKDVWMDLRGVENGLPKSLCSSKMVNLDGKLCVVWEVYGDGNEVDIMCAEIEVKRDADGGISGTILRMDVILVVPIDAIVSQCLAVEF